MRWVDAHRTAMLAAAHAHRDLRVADVGPVDIFRTIEMAGILLAFEPMPRLSGAYVAESASPSGIVINSNHPLSRQRFTAAHELAHWYLKHGTTVDPNAGSYADGGRAAGVSDQEKVADAFASWFLMPRKRVRETLNELGLERPTIPQHVYNVALRFGVSYESAAWHMLNLKLATRPTIQKWLSTKPVQIKRVLGGPFLPRDLRSDVWAIGRVDAGRPLFVRPGDRLIVQVAEIASSGYVWTAHADDAALTIIGEEYRDAITRTIDGEPIIGSASTHLFVMDVNVIDYRRRTELWLRESPMWDPDETEDHLQYELIVEPPRHGFAERWFDLTA